MRLPYRKRLVMLFWLGVSLFALIVLAAGISRMELDARPLIDPSVFQSFLQFLRESSPLRGLLVLVLLVFLGFSLYTVLTSLGRGEEPKPRKFSWIAVFQLVLWVIALWQLREFLRENPPNLAIMPPPSTGNAAMAVESPTPLRFAGQPDWILYGISLLVTLALLLAVWFAIRRFPRRESAVGLISRRAEHAIQELQLGADFHQTILRCYAEMCLVLQQDRGLQRDEGMTAREFERRLVQKGVPPEPVRELTRLFELIRYSPMPSRPDQEQRAVQCLREIVQASKGSV